MFVLFLAELNGLNSWGTDIGNAHLDSETTEKVCVIVDPEFEKLEGETLIRWKAQHVLRCQDVVGTKD